MRQSMALGKKKALAASVLGGLAAFCSPAYATTQTFDDTITGLGGHVTLTSGAGTVTVTLSDTFATPSSLANLLSDLAFSVTGGTSVSATNYSAPNTNFITLSNGNATVSSGPGTSNPWTLSGGSTGYLFTGLNGGDQTRTLIIGPVSSTICQPAGNKCPDGLGNANFNPYIDQTATFTLAIAGVTSDSRFSNVGFSYGTAGEISTIPIPAAAWLFVSGLLGLIGIARRKISPASASLAAA
jgi:hypothetical protein